MLRGGLAHGREARAEHQCRHDDSGSPIEDPSSPATRITGLERVPSQECGSGQRNRNGPFGPDSAPAHGYNPTERVTCATRRSKMTIEARILDNDSRTIGDTLSECLSRSREADVAVAFAKRSGLEELRELSEFQRRGGRLRFLAGSDFAQTEIELLDDLGKLSGVEVKMRVACDAADSRRVFHPKVYVCREESRVSAIVGSANFTRGGLRKNVETAVWLSGPPDDPVLRDVASDFERHWQSRWALPVSDKLREAYSRARRERLEAIADALESGRQLDAQRQLRHTMLDLVSPELHGGRTWLLITSPENYPLCLNGPLWGDDRRASIEQMQVHDRVIFYIKQMKRLGAIGFVRGPAFEARQPYWPDRFYRYRLQLDVFLRPDLPIDFKALLPRLRGFRSGRSWGAKLQRSSLELDPDDAVVMWEAVKAASIRWRESGLLVAEGDGE